MGDFDVWCGMIKNFYFIESKRVYIGENKWD